MKITSIFVIIISIASSIDAFKNEAVAQTSLNPFIGKWEGSGTLFNNPAKFELEFSLELNNKFLHVKFHNAYAIQGKDYSMDARAYYAIAKDSLSGQWFDSRGVQLPVNAVLDGTTLTSLWGNTETEEGKTVYTLKDNDELFITDFVKRKGVFTQFGEATYKRVQ